MIVSASVLSAGCYDTVTLSGPAARTLIGALATGPHRGPANLRTRDAEGRTHTVHLGPDTALRFELQNGATTSWIEAGDLVADRAGIAVLAAPAEVEGDGPVPAAPTIPCGDAICERQVLSWADVGQIALRNFDGPETLLSFAGAVEAVVVDSVYDESSRQMIADALSDVGHAAGEIPARSAYRPSLRAPGADGSDDIVLDASLPGTVFAPQARRRAQVAVLVGDEAGVLQGGARGALEALVAGIELRDLVDFAVVGKALDSRLSVLPAAWRRSGAGVPGMAYGLGGRLSFDMPLDPDRHVFLPVGIEGGSLYGQGLYLDLQYGVEVAVGDGFHVGVRPFNYEWVGGAAGGRGFLHELTLRVAF